MTNFVASMVDIKRGKNKNKKDEEDEEGDMAESDSSNLNKVCTVHQPGRSDLKNSMGMIPEGLIPMEVVDSLLEFISTLKIPGAVLVFLPGWAVI